MSSSLAPLCILLTWRNGTTKCPTLTRNMGIPLDSSFYHSQYSCCNCGGYYYYLFFLLTFSVLFIASIFTRRLPSQDLFLCRTSLSMAGIYSNSKWHQALPCGLLWPTGCKQKCHMLCLSRSLRTIAFFSFVSKMKCPS